MPAFQTGDLGLPQVVHERIALSLRDEVRPWPEIPTSRSRSGLLRRSTAGAQSATPITSTRPGSAITPGQRDVRATAPVQLIYVVDLHRLTHTVGFEEPGLYDPEVQKSYYYVDTGLIAQNVYLFAAAHGLAAWFHSCDRTGLAQHLGLNAHQHVLFAQSVGYPSTH